MSMFTSFNSLPVYTAHSLPEQGALRELFEKNGYENTVKTAQLAAEYAKAHGLKYVVLASKTGYTIDIFMETFAKAYPNMAGNARSIRYS